MGVGELLGDTGNQSDGVMKYTCSCNEVSRTITILASPASCVLPCAVAHFLLSAVVFSLEM